MRTGLGRTAAWGLAAMAGVLSLIAGCRRAGGPAKSPLLVYVGGTMRPAMEEIARLYSAHTGRQVDLDYGDSGANAIKVETTGRGDLYVGHDPFAGFLEQKGLSTATWTVAALTPVIVVERANPKGIRGPADLAGDDVRLGLTHETYTTLGHICPIIFTKAGVAEKIARKEIVRMRSGGDVATQVALGHLDAAVVWNAVAHLRREKLLAIPIEPLLLPAPDVDAVTSATYGRIDMGAVRVTVSTLACSTQPEQARRFAEFCASPRGLEVFARLGFSPAPPTPSSSPTPLTPGLERSERPGTQPASAPGSQPIHLYAGAGLKPALDDAVAAFTAGAGQRVVVDYGGSGILVSRVKLERRGDLFMPGDMDYVDQVAREGLVDSKVMVAYFVPVILVAGGNPKGVQALADLTQPGLRLGLGRADACQIGRSSEALFEKNRIDRAGIKRNLVYQSITVNELGMAVRLGSIDAAIVWDAVAAQYADQAEAVPIPLEQNAVSPVAAALLTFSTNKQAARELMAFLSGPKGREIFRAHQYRVEPPE